MKRFSVKGSCCRFFRGERDNTREKERVMKQQTTSYSVSREGSGVVATSTLLEALLALGIPKQAALVLAGFRTARPGSEPHHSNGTFRPDGCSLAI
jgi:hypothetical protein